MAWVYGLGIAASGHCRPTRVALKDADLRFLHLLAHLKLVLIKHHAFFYVTALTFLVILSLGSNLKPVVEFLSCPQVDGSPSRVLEGTLSCV